MCFLHNPVFSGVSDGFMFANWFLMINDIMATPHKARLTAWRHICLHLFRHLAQKFLAGRQPSGVISIQSDEKSDCASAPPALCGVALSLSPLKRGHRNIKVIYEAHPYNKTALTSYTESNAVLLLRGIRAVRIPLPPILLSNFGKYTI